MPKNIRRWQCADTLWIHVSCGIARNEVPTMHFHCAFQSASSPALAAAGGRWAGRHLVATRAIEAGETILEAQPYAAVVFDDLIDEICHRCFKTGRHPSFGVP